MLISESLVVGGIVTIRRTRTQMAVQMLADHSEVARGHLTHPRVVTSSNGYVIARFHAEPSFRRLITQADIVDADGMPLIFATKLLCKSPLVERVATTDFIHDAAQAAIGNDLKFYFLGGKPGIALRAADNLRAIHDGLDIVGLRHGYFKPEEEESICAEIRALDTDVLWVGLGSPYQEAFAIRNRERLKGLTWIRTCGGLFDHCAGTVTRAPQWMRQAGLEWLHRAMKEPVRLGGRYLVTNPLAAYHLLTKTYDTSSQRFRRLKHYRH